jgi:bacteriophage N4 adsorption protein A
MAQRVLARMALVKMALAGLTLAAVSLAEPTGLSVRPVQAAPDLLRSWRRFTSYPHLARGYTALRQGKATEAEREARHILSRIDRDSREARQLLAEALLPQGRYGEALDALAPLPPGPLQRQIQLSWLNQRQPVPSHRIERWLLQSRSSQERDQLAVAHAEQLRRQQGPLAAWRWLQTRGGPLTYRTGLAELVRDWAAVQQELGAQARRGPLPPLLQKRLLLARQSLARPSQPNLARGTPPAAAVAARFSPSTDLDQRSYQLIVAGQPAQALALLEQHLGRASGPVGEPLASRLVNLYGQVRPPSSALLARLAPRLEPELRGRLYTQLVDRGQCQRLPALAANPGPTAASEWLARGECSLASRPGEAVVYLQRAEALGLAESRNLLAFALAAAGEPAEAYRVWSTLPTRDRDQPSVQAAMAQVALELGRLEQAEQHWQTLAQPTLAQWRLGGLIAQARGTLALALERYGPVLASSRDGADFYQAGLIARQLGARQQARAWLSRANELSPGNGRYLSDTGFTLSQDPDRSVRDQAVPVLLEASRQLGGNAAIEAELGNRYREQRNRPAALQHLAAAISLESDGASATEPLETPAQRQRIYGLKRTYEALARNDSWLINVTAAPDGVAQTINEALINANNSFVGTVIYEHRLAPRLATGSLFGYGRVISANDAFNGQNQTAGGLGLRWAPIQGLNTNLFAEAYQGQLGQITSSDLLLRINGSLLDQGHWNAEWKEDRRAWNERSLYFDAAWFVNQGQTLSLVRYSQGRTWRLGGGLARSLQGGSAQTLSPYLLGQFTQQNAQTDLRVGLGLRWQLWFGQDQRRAYRRKLTARGELQQSLGGNLYSNSTGVVLSLQADL